MESLDLPTSITRTVCGPEDLQVIKAKAWSMVEIMETLASEGPLSIGVRYRVYEDVEGEKEEVYKLSVKEGDTLDDEKRRTFFSIFIHGARLKLDIIIDHAVNNYEIERRVVNFLHGAGAWCTPKTARTYCTDERQASMLPEALHQNVLPTHTIKYRGPR